MLTRFKPSVFCHSRQSQDFEPTRSLPDPGTKGNDFRSTMIISQFLLCCSLKWILRKESFGPSWLVHDSYLSFQQLHFSLHVVRPAAQCINISRACKTIGVVTYCAVSSGHLRAYRGCDLSSKCVENPQNGLEEFLDGVSYRGHLVEWFRTIPVPSKLRCDRIDIRDEAKGKSRIYEFESPLLSSVMRFRPARPCEAPPLLRSGIQLSISDKSMLVSSDIRENFK